MKPKSVQFNIRLRPAVADSVKTEAYRARVPRATVLTAAMDLLKDLPAADRKAVYAKAQQWGKLEIK